MEKTKRKEKGRVETVAYFLKGNKRFFALGILCSLLVAFLDMLGPKIVQYTVDHIIGNEDPADTVRTVIEGSGGREYLREHLYLIAGAVVLLALTAALFRYLYRLFNAMGAERLIKRMRDLLFEHIQHLPYVWHGKNHTGDILQRCTSDVETIKSFLSEQLTMLFRVVILIGLAMYFMVGISAKMALVSGIFIPVIILYSIYFHNRIAASFMRADEEEGKLSAIAQENLTGVRVVRAFGREKYERERFETQNHGYTLLWIRLMGYLSAFWCSNDFITGLQVLLVTVIGAVYCVKGSISVGESIAFVSYNGMLSWPVRELGRVISDMSKAGVSVDRIRYIMNSEREDEADPDGMRDAGSRKQADRAAFGVAAEAGSTAESGALSETEGVPAGDIVFEHVSFAYEEGREVLSDVSFTIREGSTVGILGGTGSGKSTLMYLLDRLYDLPEGCGRITIGGRDIKDIDRKALRRHIGLVLQEPFLFSRTLAENIAVTRDIRETPGDGEAAADGRKAVGSDGIATDVGQDFGDGTAGVRDGRERNAGAPDDRNGTAGGAWMEEVRRAAKAAALDETIEKFADGYDTFVGERGVTLSGGQKQRTAIAQVLMKKPPVMVFDDSLSAVDMETDAKIRQRLKAFTGEATVVLISHRIVTLMQADRIIVLDHGRIAEAGSHEELLSADGLYRKIYEIQMQGTETGEDAPETQRT